MKKKILIIFGMFLIGFASFAADLPSNGATPPAVVRSSGYFPGDPVDPSAAPIGSGLALLLGMSGTYFLVKRKKK